MIRTYETLPRLYTKLAGLLYLFIIISGIFSEMFVRNKLIIGGDANLTAENIINSQLLWRTGILVDLCMHVCDIPLMLILYLLLKPVSKYLAMLALLFTLVQTTVMVAFKLNLLQALFLLGDADYLKVLMPDQLHALAYNCIKSDAYGFGFGLLFFGLACIITGYLIMKSGYLPKFIGILMQIGGMCYLISSATLIISPKFAEMLMPVILLPSFIAELSLSLWLLFKGVDMQKWKNKLKPD